MKNNLFLLSILLIILSLSFSVFADENADYFAASPFHKGDVSFTLPSASYHAGDLISTNITVSNLEEYPLVDAYLVAEIETGQEHVYPSQLSDANNVFYEEIIRGISLEGGEKKNVPFEYKLPEDLQSGQYTLAVYFTGQKALLVGIPAIFASPKVASFAVQGTGNFPAANIIRTKTVFANATGPIGAGVSPGSLVDAQVSISGLPAEGDEFSLNVTICSWDDTSCGANAFFGSRVYKIGPNQKDALINVSFTAPSKPDAYAIRLELSDSSRTMSLYRSRIVVTGEAAKIREAAIDKTSYEAGEYGKVFLLLGASPDYYTNPVLNDSLATVYILDGVTGAEVYRRTEAVGILSADVNDGLQSLVFPFKSVGVMRNFQVCSEIASKAGVLYDKYCFTVGPTNFPHAQRKQLNVSWVYDASAKALLATVCSPGPIDGKAAVILFSNDSQSIVASADGLALTLCAQAALSAGPGEYVLAVNDLETNEQAQFPVNITSDSVTPKVTVPGVCGDDNCGPGEDLDNCCTDCGCTGGEKCDNNSCVRASPTPAKPVLSRKPYFDNYLFVGIALLALVALVFVLRRRKK